MCAKFPPRWLGCRVSETKVARATTTRQDVFVGSISSSREKGKLNDGWKESGKPRPAVTQSHSQTTTLSTSRPHGPSDTHTHITMLKKSCLIDRNTLMLKSSVEHDGDAPNLAEEGNIKFSSAALSQTRAAIYQGKSESKTRTVTCRGSSSTSRVTVQGSPGSPVVR